MIGKLRHRITLQKSVVTHDDIGQELEEWQDVATVWASVEPLSGKEYFNAQQINSAISTKIGMRYLPGITTDMRVYFKRHPYNILSIINLEERNLYLQLLCSEKVGDMNDGYQSRNS